MPLLDGIPVQHALLSQPMMYPSGFGGESKKVLRNLSKEASNSSQLVHTQSNERSRYRGLELDNSHLTASNILSSDQRKSSTPGPRRSQIIVKRPQTAGYNKPQSRGGDSSLERSKSKVSIQQTFGNEKMTPS